MSPQQHVEQLRQFVERVRRSQRPTRVMRGSVADRDLRAALGRVGTMVRNLWMRNGRPAAADALLAEEVPGRANRADQPARAAASAGPAAAGPRCTSIEARSIQPAWPRPRTRPPSQSSNRCWQPRRPPHCSCRRAPTSHARRAGILRRHGSPDRRGCTRAAMPGAGRPRTSDLDRKPGSTATKPCRSRGRTGQATIRHRVARTIGTTRSTSASVMRVYSGSAQHALVGLLAVRELRRLAARSGRASRGAGAAGCSARCSRCRWRTAAR
jgi:hypothetical protein